MMPSAAELEGSLTLSKKCGETFCPDYHLCLDHDSQCYPCLSYCNRTSHNFDESICVRQCQDYIHDFVRHYVQYDEIKNTLAKLESMQTWVIFIAVMVFIALVFVSVTLAFIWGRERRMRKIKNGGQDSFFKKKLASLQYMKKTDQVKTVSETVSDRTPAANGVTSLAATQTDLQTAVSSASSGQRTDTSSAGGNSTATSSSSSSGGGGGGSSNKLPCEDATLEFSGYDNYALKVSPVMSGKTACTADLFQQYTP